MNKYIRTIVAPYALPKILLSLSDISIAITQEDNELVISLETKELQALVYGATQNMCEDKGVKHE